MGDKVNTPNSGLSPERKPGSVWEPESIWEWAGLIAVIVLGTLVVHMFMGCIPFMKNHVFGPLNPFRVSHNPDVGR